MTTGGDCDDSNVYVSPIMTEVQDGIDNNCNNEVDENNCQQGESLIGGVCRTQDEIEYDYECNVEMRGFVPTAVFTVFEDQDDDSWVDPNSSIELEIPYATCDSPGLLESLMGSGMSLYPYDPDDSNPDIY